MNDFDKELKKIQLRREQLGLERDELVLARERAREKLKDRITAGLAGLFSTVVRIVFAMIAEIRLLIARWFKLILICFIFLVLTLGAMEWKLQIEEKRELAEQQRRALAEEAFVLKSCGSKCEGDGTIRDTFACDAQNLDRYYPCRSEAKHRFAREWKDSK